MLNHSADLNTMPTFETINATCNILDKHSFVSHFYTDNVQLYLTFHRTDITTCTTEDINDWMASNHFMMNPSKTPDVLLCSTNHQPPELLRTPVSHRHHDY